jgi:hypothetical protein
VIIVGVALAVVHLVLIQEIVRLLREVLVHLHHHVVHRVDQDPEVIIENLLDVQTIIVHNNPIIMEKDEVVV